jgi:propanol-preferring alcohol dehydrogenase
MPQKMKAAVVHEFGRPLVIEEVDIPEVPPGQVLVKVVASGVCHTDLHAASGDWPVKPTLPFIPGHEGVGYVARVGAGVKFLKEGDRVGVPWLHTTCGHCEHCMGGWETLCDHQQMTGYTVNGGYAEYVLADPGYVGHLPANLEFAPAAPVLCAGVTVYKGLKVLDCKPGDWVAISGIGGLGHMAVQYAKAMGFHVIAVDVAEDKLALARWPKCSATCAAPTACSSPPSRARPLPRAWACCTSAAPCHSWACRPGALSCPSSTWCSTPRPCAAPSWAPGST